MDLTPLPSFPEYTMNGEPATAKKWAGEEKPVPEPAPAVVWRARAAEPPPVAIIEPMPEPTPAPTAVPPAIFQVALRLPLKRAYVMVRLNDREVFRCDFRSKGPEAAPELLSPPIETAAGPVELKVWVISPDAKAAREYVVLPLSLEPGQNPTVALAFDPARMLTARLVRAGS